MCRRWIEMMVGAVLLALVLARPAAGQEPGAEVRRAVEVRVIEHHEFRWGDALIGSLAGFGVAALCAGVLVATERRRRSRS